MHRASFHSALSPCLIVGLTLEAMLVLPSHSLIAVDLDVGSQDGITVDLDKVKAILQAPTPTNAKALSRFLGQIRWHNRMIRYLADVSISLHTAVHKMPFQWKTVEQDAYDCLKKMLTKVPVVQPPDWEKPFHVFVDASDVAIDSSLMQLTKPNWYIT